MDLRFVTPRPTAAMDVHDDPFPSTEVREVKIELSKSRILFGFHISGPVYDVALCVAGQRITRLFFRAMRDRVSHWGLVLEHR